MKCFYHNDMDGRCAGALVAQHEQNYNREDFFEVDYIMDLSPMLARIADGEKVYFVDYSFKENTKHILHSLIARECDVIWIDHHTSSLELEKTHGWKIEGIRSDEASGAALVYMYFNKCSFDELPYYVKLVSDYDCWKYKFDPDTTRFKIGLETEEYDALDNVWMDLTGIGAIDILEVIMDRGKTIKGYIDRDNEQYRKQYAYESVIGGYKALVVNRKTNSWVFGEKYNEYPVVCVWAFNGDRYSYSIFSGDKSVDCSKIAESYGGGGHKGAAGFSSDELLFVKCQ